MSLPYVELNLIVLMNWFNDLTILNGNNPSQADDAKKILDELVQDRTIQELYVTGHSLGGYLAQRFAVEAYQHYPHFYGNRLRSIVTFNAPKVVTARTIWNAKNGLWDVGLISKQLTEEGKNTKKRLLPPLLYLLLR